MKDPRQEALLVAAESKCEKRKVGAVIVDPEGHIIVSASNYHPKGLSCELKDGTTDPDVIHAEQHAIKILRQLWDHEASPFNLKGYKMYITHLPCTNCLTAINAVNLEYEVVEEFMKFDTTKLRYDLIPPSIETALAEVFTYGAKKYKPNNWRKVDSPDRYVAAVMRHWNAYRKGEWLDENKYDDKGNLIEKGSGMPHLWHVATNIAFLIELEYKISSP